MPAGGVSARHLATWEKGFVAHLMEHQVSSAFWAPALKAGSNPGESEADFRLRLGQRAREARDAAADKLRKKYATKLTALDERLRKAESRIAREEGEATRQHVDTAVSVGAGILGALFGRKVASASNVGRARSAVRSASRSLKERGDIEAARADAEAARAQRAELEAQVEREVAALAGLADPTQLEVQRLSAPPRKADISIGVIGLAWVP
jgi:hypothetical protein